MKTLTLKSLINQFLKWSETTLKPNTVNAYRHHLRCFLGKVKNKQVRSLRPIHLTSAQRSWHDWQAVQRLMSWAVNEAQVMKKNPFARVKAPGRNQRKRILTPGEMAKFLRGARRAWRGFLLAIRELGARPQEVRALTWADLQSDNPAVSVEAALTAGTAVFVLWEFKDRSRRKDSTSPRVLMVTRRLGRLLFRLRRRSPTPEAAVFTNTRGLPWTKNAVRCMMRSLRRRLGFVPDQRGERIVAYTFRHSVATLAAAHGILDRALADWLGHVETRTTRRYQHLCVGHIREALRRMERPARVILPVTPAERSATSMNRKRRQGDLAADATPRPVTPTGE